MLKRRDLFPHDERARAFTLVELLVVIAIVAILASLLLPALSRGKGAALATDCRNNLRTLGLGMQMYLGDFHAYPPTAGAGIMGYGEKYGWLMMNDWKLKLIPFIGVNDDRFTDRQDTMFRRRSCGDGPTNELAVRGEASPLEQRRPAPSGDVGQEVIVRAAGAGLQCEPQGQSSGCRQRRPGKRANPRSREIHSQSCSMARAAW